MTPRQEDPNHRLKWRQALEWIAGPALILLALYLRLFVFLRISLGAMLIFFCFLGGVLLVDDARKAGKRIEAAYPPRDV